jgi:hypothetical protein
MPHPPRRRQENELWKLVGVSVFRLQADRLDYEIEFIGAVDLTALQLAALG